MNVYGVELVLMNREKRLVYRNSVDRQLDAVLPQRCIEALEVLLGGTFKAAGEADDRDGP